MVGAEHHGAGERDRGQREHDGKEGKPDQLKPHSGEVPQTSAARRPAANVASDDDDGEQDHGENR